MDRQLLRHSGPMTLDVAKKVLPAERKLGRFAQDESGRLGRQVPLYLVNGEWLSELEYFRRCKTAIIEARAQIRKVVMATALQAGKDPLAEIERLTLSNQLY